MSTFCRTNGRSRFAFAAIAIRAVNKTLVFKKLWASVLKGYFRHRFDASGLRLNSAPMMLSVDSDSSKCDTKRLPLPNAEVFKKASQPNISNSNEPPSLKKNKRTLRRICPIQIDDSDDDENVSLLKNRQKYLNFVIIILSA